MANVLALLAILLSVASLLVALRAHQLAGPVMTPTLQIILTTHGFERKPVKVFVGVKIANRGRSAITIDDVGLFFDFPKGTMDGDHEITSTVPIFATDVSPGLPLRLEGYATASWPFEFNNDSSPLVTEQAAYCSVIINAGGRTVTHRESIPR